MAGKKNPAAAAAGDADEQSKKVPKVDSSARSQCVAFFSRMAQGQFKRATEEEKKKAQQVLNDYQDYSAAEKDDFAAQFYKNKGKGFGWIKNFSDTLTTHKNVTSGAVEKYCNRTAFARMCRVCTWGARAYPRMM